MMKKKDHSKAVSGGMQDEKAALKKQIKELKRKRDGLIELTKRGLAPLEDIIHVLKEKETETEVRIHRLEGELEEKKKASAELDKKYQQETLLLEAEFKAKKKTLKIDYKKKEQALEENLKKKEQEALLAIKKKEAESEEKHQSILDARKKELDAVLLNKMEMEERIALLEKEFHTKKKWFEILSSAHDKSDVSSNSLNSSKELELAGSAGSINVRKMSGSTASLQSSAGSVGLTNLTRVISCWALDVGRFKLVPSLLLDIQLNLEDILPSENWSFVQESSLGDQKPFAQFALAEVSDGILSMKYALSTSVNHKKKVAPVVILLLAKLRASPAVSEALVATEKFLTDETKAPIFVLHTDQEGRMIPPASNDDNAVSIKALADFLGILAVRGAEALDKKGKKEKEKGK